MMTPHFSSLVDSAYKLISTAAIWKRNDLIGISDGDEVEDRILRVIENSKDIGSLSDELEVNCIDLPPTYHLSKRREILILPKKP